MISFTKYYTSLLLSVLILLMTACSNDDSNGGGSSQTGDAYWKISSTVKSASGSQVLLGQYGMQKSLRAQHGVLSVAMI
jgi:endonuclease G